MITILDRHFELSIPESVIQEKVKNVAERLNKDYAGKNPAMVCILNGAYMFAADLSRYLTFQPEIIFARFSSYEGMKSTGTVKELVGVTASLHGRDVIIVEDIVDSGLSMKYMIEELKKLEPASIAICTFYYKPDNFKEDFKIDYVGKEIPNDFIVGYGLDYDGVGRTYRDVYVVDDDE